jgi:Ricin-type beta-trefoil lectin domain
MPKLRTRTGFGIIAAAAFLVLAVPSVAMAATTPGQPASVGSFSADAVTAPAAASAVPPYLGVYGTSEIKNASNMDCLNGTLALVYLTPCNGDDSHMIWTADGYDVDGHLAYMLVNGSSGYCLNGYTGTAHAQVTLTPCNPGDSHMLWWTLGIYGGSPHADGYQNVSNGYCLDGYTGSAHAQVTVTTPCSSSNNHQVWWNSFDY